MTTSAPAPASRAHEPHWPRRLLQLHGVLRSTRGKAIRQQALSEAWLLIHSALSRYLAAHAAKMGGASREDLEDLSSEKALELAARLESGTWDPSGHDPGAVAGFLSTAARNGLVDLFRKRGRMVNSDEEEMASHVEIGERMSERPEESVDRGAFTESLQDCVGHLGERDRSVWFFRVFYELPSREIATHPDVGLKAPHVDVILQRCRKSVRECMARKGYEPSDMPPGTFVALWSAFRLPSHPGGMR